MQSLRYNRSTSGFERHKKHTAQESSQLSSKSRNMIPRHSDANVLFEGISYQKSYKNYDNLLSLIMPLQMERNCFK